MDSNTGGQSSSDLQRQAAAQIARRKVLEAYNKSVAKKNADKGAHTSDTAHLKSAPVEKKINSESWKQYHSAWQNYYQKYYSEYYSNAARDYIAKEKLKAERARLEEEEISSALASAGKATSDKTGLNLAQGGAQRSSASGKEDMSEVRAFLRKRIRAKATDNAKIGRKFRKFIPLLAGLAVVLVILFLQYNRLIFAPLMAYVSPGNAPASEIEAIDPTISKPVSADPRLIIPKLNIDVPIRFDIAVTDIMAAMNNGVAHYRINGASAYPGEIGNFIITGHSAGDVYSSNPYKYIFSGLERLEDGDLIYVNYNSVRYTYKVIKKEVVEPSDVAALIVQTDKPLITLVTCTPLGTSRYRLLVTGEQISPSYENASQPSIDDATPVIDSGMELPSNEPSFFERIWNFLTGQ
ncbi:class E sortase [Candidatus Saccharibacteria bacterium]|nr:class E sortase [Candidatus Saccharibacteria bacterium]